LTPDLDDTIVALSSAAGPGGRAIVRLSGPAALSAARAVFRAAEPVDPALRRRQVGALELPGLPSLLPADLYVWPAPYTYTGQELVEIHPLSSPPLVDSLIAVLLGAGCRAARPGEFTLRGFLNGKFDLTRAEAVRGVIEAGGRDELRQALTHLAGGVGRPLQELRDDLLDLLAEVEAGLDFADEDIDFVSQKQLLDRLAKGMAEVTNLQRQLSDRALGDRPFRTVLAGRPNAGKSSLFNALARATALVSPAPGTTRDYLVRRVKFDDVVIELVDTAGWLPAPGAVEEQAQRLGREQAGQADLVLLCIEAGRAPDEQEQESLTGTGPPPVIGVATKCDIGPTEPHRVATSAVTGVGLDSLRALLAERARAWTRPGLAPSLSRGRHHVEAALAHLRQAHAAVLYEDPAEVLALELRGALDELGEMVGAVYTDDLLDRIFSRFCIGK
jgi:tRNA modification GTPase